ncbi:MAG: 23S rRNA (guanosine(2251)-2'-O)-methyltransferase RlmB [Deltaproteobacteria bacterium]|nr:23S rRNA (guanosine(2251)-2'-O)-methyltransferase RlmB [Deltaproteobacteria bacterium]
MVFGRNPVMEMLRGSAAAVRELYVAEGSQGVEAILAEARVSGIRIERVARQVLDGLVAGGHHQGIAVRTKPVAFVAIEDIIARAPSLFVALDGIQDPQNLGAIIRAAEVLGAGGVMLPKDRSAGVTAAAIRASSGAAIHLPIAQVVNLARALVDLKAAGYWSVGLDAGGTSRFQDLPTIERAVVVVGAEGRGIRPLVARACDFTVAIPVRGRVASLNAATAAAIALYEMAARVLPDPSGGPVR